MSRTQRLWLAYGTLALVCAGAAMALVLTSHHEDHKVAALFVGEILGLSFVLAGLLGTTSRPVEFAGRYVRPSNPAKTNERPRISPTNSAVTLWSS